MKPRQMFAALLGVIVALLGLVWLLQGASVLPGSVMSGSQFWEVAGAIVFIVGIVIVAVSVRHVGTP
jgi:hypothetical protein